MDITVAGPDADDLSDTLQGPGDHLAVALSLRQSGDLKQAAAILEAGLSVAPDSLDLRYHLGLIYKDLGRTREAMRCFREVMTRDPAHLDAAVAMACLFQEGGYLDQAITLFSRLVDRTPDDARAHQRLGDALRDSGQLEGALECYQRALDLDPDQVDALYGRAGVLAGEGAVEEAEADYRRLLTLVPDHLDAYIELGNLCRRLVPQWHFPMLNNTERNDAFEQAIRRAIKPGHLVLDVGCGTGLLSMMAARAGAERVIACEVVDSIARTAAEIIERHGLAERIRVVPLHSTLLHVGEHLPRRADLLVAEVVDAALLGEGMITVVRHARAHLLTPEARVIPGGATIHAMLLDSPSLWQDNQVQTVSGFDLSAFNRFTHPASFQRRLQNYSYTALCDPFEVLSFDFNAWPPAQQERRIDVPVLRDGTCHAVAIWFDLRVDDQVSINTCPDNSNSCWMQAVQLLRGNRVAAGETLALRVRHSECNILFDLIP